MAQYASMPPSYKSALASGTFSFRRVPVESLFSGVAWSGSLGWGEEEIGGTFVASGRCYGDGVD